MKALRHTALLAAAIAPVSAFAHPGHDGHDFTWDFNAGFAHPLSGWDHLLALLAVGIWAAQLGGRARWLVPAAFLAAMSAGAVLGYSGVEFSGTEQAIAASVFVIGLLVTISARLPVAAAMGLAGLFALFHGLAHGAEIPLTGHAFQYGVGFVAATTLLLVGGLAFGLFATRTTARWVNYAGAAIAIGGIVLFAA